MSFDNLAYLSIDKQVTHFPMHFHDTFCISLIHNGLEQINLLGQTVYCENSSISITNPYEIHSNPLSDSNLSLAFDTIYISEDVMQYANNGNNISFKNKTITNTLLNSLFINLKESINSKNDILIHKALKDFIHLLKNYSEQKNEIHTELSFNSFQNLSQFIDENIAEKLTLDQLANISNLNKFSFSKKFKSTTGMTPMNYILMKKVYASKKIITENTELTDLAYTYNFTDLAHFSNTFKRFVGISPNKYQKTLL